MLTYNQPVSTLSPSPRHSLPSTSHLPSAHAPSSIMHAVFYEQTRGRSGLDYLAQVAMYVMERESSSASDRSEYSDTDHVQAPQAVALCEKTDVVSRCYSYPPPPSLNLTPPPSPLVSDAFVAPAQHEPRALLATRARKDITKKAIGAKTQAVETANSSNGKPRVVMPAFRKVSSAKKHAKSAPLKNRPRWKCPECHKAVYPRNHDIERHKLTHLPVEQRPFHCDVPGCTFSTIQKSNLDTHTKTHNGAKAVCGVLCVLKDGLQGPCPFKCSDRGQMTRHRQKMHDHPTRGEKNEKECLLESAEKVMSSSSSADRRLRVSKQPTSSRRITRSSTKISRISHTSQCATRTPRD